MNHLHAGLSLRRQCATDDFIHKILPTASDHLRHESLGLVVTLPVDSLGNLVTLLYFFHTLLFSRLLTHNSQTAFKASSSRTGGGSYARMGYSPSPAMAGR